MGSAHTDWLAGRVGAALFLACGLLAIAGLALAAPFAVGVTAEGIETAAQVAELRALGCARGQGFHFWRPLTAADVDQLLLGGAERVA